MWINGKEAVLCGGQVAMTAMQAKVNTASWVIVRKATGEAVLETFNPKVAMAINRDRYTAVPIHDYLIGVNAKAKL